jgi:hypothetical protein
MNKKTNILVKLLYRWRMFVWECKLAGQDGEMRMEDWQKYRTLKSITKKL